MTIEGEYKFLNRFSLGKTKLGEDISLIKDRRVQYEVTLGLLLKPFVGPCSGPQIYREEVLHIINSESLEFPSKDGSVVFSKEEINSANISVPCGLPGLRCHLKYKPDHTPVVPQARSYTVISRHRS